jgi:hypothetical protein
MAASGSLIMHRSRHAKHELPVLLCEAETGVPIAEIYSTASVSLRTFYRRRYVGALIEHRAVVAPSAGTLRPMAWCRRCQIAS